MLLGPWAAALPRGTDWVLEGCCNALQMLDGVERTDFVALVRLQYRRDAVAFLSSLV